MTADELAERMYRGIFHDAAEPFSECLKYAQLLLEMRQALRYWLPDETMVVPKHQDAWYTDTAVLARADEILGKEAER